MADRRITDWDDAYANMPYIPDAEAYISRWIEHAAAFRSEASCEIDVSYGDGERDKYDQFHPNGQSKGLFVFVHGGYWLRFDKSYWSHFAAGALERGYSVCMPSYPLCPDVEIGDILSAVKTAIEQCASTIDGPIYLCGHSAGGLIASMLTTTGSEFESSFQQRIRKTISIAGVHDLRPLMNTQLNERLKLTEQTVRSWSPVLAHPIGSADLICWVGDDERPEFVRQSALLANIWTGLGALTYCHTETGRHHFDVIDGLRDPDSALMRAVFED